MTLLFRIAIAIYLGFLIFDVANRKSELKLSINYRNLYHDMTSYSFANGTFDMAVGI